MNVLKWTWFVTNKMVGLRWRQATWARIESPEHPDRDDREWKSCVTKNSIKYIFFSLWIHDFFLFPGLSNKYQHLQSEIEWNRKANAMNSENIMNMDEFISFSLNFSPSRGSLMNIT